MASTPLADRVRPGDAFSSIYNFDADGIANSARLTGDRNPVHHDRDAAASSRFGKRIASAQHSASLMLGLAATWLAERGTSFGLGCSFRFMAAVLEGDTVELRWVVADTAYKESLNGMVIVLEGTARNAHGRECVRGTCEMLLVE